MANGGLMEKILKKRKMIKTLGLSIIVSLFCIFPIHAEELDSGLTGRRLIQTMSEQDEYEGLLHLGMLETPILAEEDIAAAYENVKPCIVKMNIGNLYGSGVILKLQEDVVTIVSCRHLLEYADASGAIEVSFTDGYQVIGKVTFTSEQYDIGFAEVQVSEIPIWTLKKLRQAVASKEAFQNVIAGTEMFHAGSTDGVGATMYGGVVADPWQFFPEFNSFMMHNYCNGKPGMSGGGTFDAYGNFIGMISGGLGEETASLPLSVILEEFNRKYH